MSGNYYRDEEGEEKLKIFVSGKNFLRLSTTKNRGSRLKAEAMTIIAKIFSLSLQPSGRNQLNFAENSSS